MGPTGIDRHGIRKKRYKPNRHRKCRVPHGCLIGGHPEPPRLNSGGCFNGGSTPMIRGGVTRTGPRQIRLCWGLFLTAILILRELEYICHMKNYLYILGLLLLTSYVVEAKASKTAAGPPGISEMNSVVAPTISAALPEPSYLLVCPELHVELVAPGEVVSFPEVTALPMIERSKETDLGKPYNTVRTDETVLSLISYKNLKTIFRLPPMHNLMC